MTGRRLRVASRPRRLVGGGLFLVAHRIDVPRLLLTIGSIALAFLATVIVWSPPADALFGFGLFEREEPVAASDLIPDPILYSVQLETPEASETVRARLLSVSRMTANDAEPVSGAVGLIAAAANEQRRLLGALYGEGYYGGMVDIAIDGVDFRDLPVDYQFATGVVPVTITVDPGPPFTFGEVRISTSENVRIDPDRFGIAAAEPARSTAILDAAEAVVATEQENGRPLARVVTREIVADHATRRLDVAIVIEPGPRAVFGSVRVEGAEHMVPAFIVAQANVPVGQPYSPAALADARRRLLELGVFDSVTVAASSMVDPDGSVPVVIVVSERKRRVIGAGAKVSNTDGGGVEVYWGHRNVFGRAESVRFEAAFGRIGNANALDEHDYSGAVIFSKPGVFGPATTLTARAFTLHEQPDAFERTAAGVSVSITRDISDRLSGTFGVGVEWSDVDDAFGTEESVLVFTRGEMVWDGRDSRLDPTRGVRVAASLSPHFDAVDGNAFVTSRASLSAYRAVDAAKRLIVAGRIAGGSIFGADLADIPAERRFYSGGGGSVRGYVFQAIGPRNAANTPTGGRSFAEASVEARLKVTEKIGLVPFLDAGSVSGDLVPGEGRWSTGGGLGVRYDTVVGPVRLDVAVPFDQPRGDPDFGVYVGIGQAF